MPCPPDAILLILIASHLLTALLGAWLYYRGSQRQSPLPQFPRLVKGGDAEDAANTIPYPRPRP